MVKFRGRRSRDNIEEVYGFESYLSHLFYASVAAIVFWRLFFCFIGDFGLFLEI